MQVPINLTTPKGPLTLQPPSQELVQSLQKALPFGLEQNDMFVPHGAYYGLIMQKGAVEVEFEKLQPPDTNKEIAFKIQMINSLLIAHTVLGLQRAGQTELLFPITYVREKRGGRFESGFAVHGPEGSTVKFLNALCQACNDSGIMLPCTTIIGVDRRPRMQLGSITFNFLVIDKTVVSLRRAREATDLVWEVFPAAGVHEMPHMPALPFQVE